MDPLVASGQAGSLTSQWEDANLAYRNLYEAVQSSKGLLKKNPLPIDSSTFLGSCAWGSFREELANKLQPFKGKSDIAQFAEQYLSGVAQLLALAAEMAGGNSWRGLLRPQHELPNAVGPANVAGAVSSAKPVSPQPPPPVAVQQQFQQSASDITLQIGQAQSILVGVQQQVSVLSHQTSQAISLMTTLQDWEEVANKLEKSEDRRRKTRDAVLEKLVGIITGFEQQYMGSVTYVSPGEPESHNTGSQFQTSVRTIITQLEQVLSSEFGLMRTNVVPGSVCDPQTMSWDERSRIAATSHDLADKVAYVTAPGYFLKRPDGQFTPYRLAHVVLYGRSR